MSTNLAPLRHKESEISENVNSQKNYLLTKANQSLFSLSVHGHPQIMQNEKQLKLR